MTSILFIEVAGILFKTSFGFLATIFEGLPLTYTVKDDEPFTFIFSSWSSVTSGTLRNISITVLVLLSGSASTS